jgi:hypothetical protein
MRVYSWLLKREDRECAAFNAAVLDRLATSKPDLTLVSVSRYVYRPLLAADDTLVRKGEALARMLSKVPGRVALIVDTVDPKWDVPGCLSAHVHDIRACAITRGIAYRVDLGAVEKAAAEAGGVALIDLNGVICPEFPCPVVANGIIVFRDEVHLSATFSRSLAPALGAAIANILPRGDDPLAR